MAPFCCRPSWPPPFGHRRDKIGLHGQFFCHLHERTGRGIIVSMEFLMRNFFLCFAILLIFFVGCGKVLAKKDTSSSQLSKVTAAPSSYEGFNLSGQKTSCPIPPEQLMCTMEYTEGEQFVAKCKSAGGQEFTCACHQYLCSKQIVFP